MRVCDNVETMLAFHGAPTLEGIKPGSLISFNKQRIKNCHLILKRYKKCMEFDILPMPKGRGFLDTNDTCLLK